MSTAIFDFNRGLFQGQPLKSPTNNTRVTDSMHELTDCVARYNTASNNLHLNEIKDLSSQLIQLKKDNVISDDDFGKIISLVFGGYIERRIDSLVSERIEQKFSNMLIGAKNARR